MKKGAFSAKNIIATNYQCLKPSRASNIDQKVQQITKQLIIQKNQRQSLPKYHSNPQPNKTQQQLRKHIKTLQQQLRKKISEHGVLCKLLKTKTYGELGHVDIYVEISQLEEKNQEKDKRINQLINEKQELNKEIQILKEMRDEQEREHTEVVSTYSQDLDKIQQKFQQKQHQYQKELSKYENDKLLIKELQKKISQLNYELQCQKDAKQIECFQLQNKYQTEIKQLQENMEKMKQQHEELENKIDEWSRKYNQLQLQNENNRNDYQKALKLSKKQIEEIVLQQQQQMKKTREQYEAQLQTIQTKYIEDNEKIVKKLKSQQQSLKQQLKGKNIEVETIYKKNNKLEEQITKIQQQYISMINQHNKMQQENTQKQQQLQSMMENVNQKNSKLLFKIQQLQSHTKQITNMILQKDKQIQQHIDSHFLKEQQIQKLKVRAKQLTQQLSKQKASNKVSVELYEKNYRAIGRLIQLNNKIARYIPETVNIQENANLDQLIQSLGKLLNQFIDKCFLPCTKKIQTIKYKNKEFIVEVQTLIGGLTSLIADDELLGFINEYLLMLRQNRHQDHENDEFGKEKRSGIVNCVQQKIFSLKTLKSLQSKNSLHAYDSLESTNKNYESIRRYIQPTRQPKRSVTTYLLQQPSEPKIQRTQTQPRRQSSLKKLKTALHNQDKQNSMFLSNKTGKSINKYERQVIMQRYFQNHKTDKK